MAKIVRVGARHTVVRGRALSRIAALSVVLIGGGAVLGFLFTPYSNGEFVGGGVLAVVGWVIWTIGISSKVTVSSDGIRVDNFFVSHIVSWKDFNSFVLDSGIFLEKHDGSRVWLIGFGGSLFGALTGYRLMQKRFEILTEAAKRFRNDQGSYATRDTVRLGLPVLGGWILVLEGAALAGRALH